MAANERLVCRIAGVGEVFVGFDREGREVFTSGVVEEWDSVVFVDWNLVHEVRGA